ncbi:MAG: carboxypeptidase regulatory-like domain-containing protein [Deltaproteobacteria bacterium]|nr:carboxypeptidase regulatory-like domain-containing protein [Deltaproteobacteria bacterium]
MIALLLVAALADERATVSSRDDSATLSLRGTAGAHRVEAALPLPQFTFVLGYQASFFEAKNFIAAGDAHRRSEHHLVLAFAPHETVQIGLMGHATSDANAGPPSAPFLSPEAQTFGDPALTLKWSLGLPKSFSIGAHVVFNVPTSVLGNGLRFDAFRLSLQALATWRPHRVIHVSANAGYLVDRSGLLFAGPLEGMLRFASGTAQMGLILVAIAADASFDIKGALGLGGFIEVSGGIAPGLAAAEHPFLFSAGVKAVAPARTLELAFGTDVRLSGAPVVDGALPGLPSWQAFVRLLVRPSLARAEPTREVVVKEVPRDVVKEIAPATFTVRGTVRSAGGAALPIGATVSVGDGDVSALAVDPATGAYRSYPLACGAGLMQVRARAPGHAPSDKTVARGAVGEVVTVDFALQPLDRPQTGELRGIVKDGRTGASLAAEIFVPSLGLKWISDDDGRFHRELPAGRHTVLVSAKGYLTQKKEIDVRPGDVVILNIDLQRS